MTKRTGIFVVGTALVLAAAAGWSLFHGHETDVYLAAIAPYPSSEAVYVSRPSTCGGISDVNGIPSALVASFLKANGPGSEPISLLPLRWQFNTADSAKLDQYSSVGPPYSTLFPQGNTPVIFSRVGFSADRSEALFCVFGRGELVMYMRQVGGQWQLVKFDLQAIP